MFFLSILPMTWEKLQDMLVKNTEQISYWRTFLFKCRKTFKKKLNCIFNLFTKCSFICPDFQHIQQLLQIYLTLMYLGGIFTSEIEASSHLYFTQPTECKGTPFIHLATTCSDY